MSALRRRGAGYQLCVEAFVLVLVAACVPLPRGRAWDSRVVTGKQAGDRLVSAGGMWCNVASTDYAKVQIGHTHRCVWSPSDARSPQRLPPP